MQVQYDKMHFLSVVRNNSNTNLVCKALEITKQGYYQKCRKGSFKLDEIFKILKLLNMTFEEVFRERSVGS